MGVNNLKAHVHKTMGYYGKKVNLSREARSSVGWHQVGDRNRGIVFDGDGYCYWATNTPWNVGNRVDFLHGGQSLPTFESFLVYFERFLSESIPICVVFDGVKPKNKALTLSSRKNKYIEESEETLTTATMGFGGSRELFTRRVMIEALEQLKKKYSPDHVIVHSALGEGDGEVTRMARHLRAFAVIGNDYDHVVLLSNAPGIFFIPIDNISFRGTEHRSFPCWEYQPGAKAVSDNWTELPKADCLRFEAAHKQHAAGGNDFHVHLSIGTGMRSAPDSKTGYVQYNILSTGNDGKVMWYSVRQPNILVLRYDIRDISLGLGLEESSLPALATLVGCDFLPASLLRGFHRYIGMLQPQGSKPDVIPAVSSLVRQHADWSHLNPESSSFPFSEDFFARASGTALTTSLQQEDATPKKMSEMSRAAVGFFILRRDRQEYMLAAALLLTGLFETYQGGWLEARVVQCLVRSSDSISMPHPLELCKSTFNSNVNVNCFPLMAITINLLKSLAAEHSSTLEGDCGDNLLASTRQELATVLKKYGLETILDVTRHRRQEDAAEVPLQSTVSAAADEIYLLMRRFYERCDVGASPVAAVPKDTVLKSARAVLLETLAWPVAGGSKSTSSVSHARRTARVAEYYNAVWAQAHADDLPAAFLAVVGEQSSDADFLDFVSLFSVLCCGYTRVWGGQYETNLLVKAYLICMMLKQGRIKMDMEEFSLDTDHVRALCLHVDISESHDPASHGFSPNSESSRVQSMITAMSSSHLLINQAIELLRVLHDQNIDALKPSFIDLVDGRLLHFVHNELVVETEQNFNISDFLGDEQSQARFEMLLDFFTVIVPASVQRAEATLSAEKADARGGGGGFRSRMTGKDVERFDTDSDEDEDGDENVDADDDDDDDDGEFRAAQALKHSHTGDGSAASVRSLCTSLMPPLRRDAGNLLVSSKAGRLDMQTRFAPLPSVMLGRPTPPAAVQEKQLPAWQLEGVEEKVQRLRDKGEEWVTARIALSRLKGTHNEASLRQEASEAFRVASSMSGFVPHRFQEESFELIRQKKSVLALAPTGSGKTFIALNAMYSALCSTNTKAALVCPTKALVNQSYATIWSQFDLRSCPEALGIHSLDLTHNADKSKVLVTVAQSFLNMLLKGKKFDVVILDEFHSILSEKDGYVWESIVNLLPPTTTQLICLSATLPHSHSVLQWLRSRHSSTEMVKEVVRNVKQELFCFARGGLSRVPQTCLSVYANDSRGATTACGLDLSAQAIHWEKKSLVEVLDAIEYDDSINELQDLSSSAANIDDKTSPECVGALDIRGLILNDNDREDSDIDDVDVDEDPDDAVEYLDVAQALAGLLEASQFVNAASTLVEHCLRAENVTQEDAKLCVRTIDNLQKAKGGVLRKFETACSVKRLELVRDIHCCLALIILFTKLPAALLVLIEAESPRESQFTETKTWQMDQICRVQIDMSLRCGYFQLNARHAGGCSSAMEVIAALQEVKAVVRGSSKLRRLCRSAAVEVKQYWLVECLRPDMVQKTNSKTKNIEGVLEKETWKKQEVVREVEPVRYECFIGMMSFLFAADMLPFEEVVGFNDIIVYNILENETVSMSMYSKLFSVAGVISDVDSELEAVKNIFAQCLTMAATKELCTLLALRLVHSRRREWIICKRVLPEIFIRPGRGDVAGIVADIFRVVISVGAMGHCAVHSALSSLLEMSLLGQTEEALLLAVLENPSNSDIVLFLKGAFTPGGMASAVLSELLRKIATTTTTTMKADFGFLLQQWNTCHRPLDYLLKQFLIEHAVSHLDVLELLQEVNTTTTTAAANTNDGRSDSCLGNLQRHEAMSVSFFLLEAYHAWAASAPPLSEEERSLVLSRGREVLGWMLTAGIERYIRVKLILAFDLSQNQRKSREMYRATMLPAEGRRVNSTDKIAEEKVAELPTGCWDDSSDEDDAPPCLGNRSISTFSESNVGLDAPAAKDARMFLRWACDMVMRQAQRASRLSNLQDDNCHQLLQYMLNNHPHPHVISSHQDQDNTSTSGCMLPALIFTFEKATATEMATKMVDVYGLDLLQGDSDAEQKRTSIKREIDALNPVEVDQAGAGRGKKIKKAKKAKMVVPAFLQRVLLRGIGVHHSAISGTCRDLVERLFNKKLIKVVFNTSSLAEGVHMPCQTVVFLQDKHTLVNSKLFRQCAGRAGRQGDSNVGFVVVTGNYTINRLQTLINGMDGREEGAATATEEYGITDEVAAAKSMLMPAARFALLDRQHGEVHEQAQRITMPLCLSEHRNFNHQMRKVDYVLQSIRDMIGKTSMALCLTSVEADMRLRPLFAFVVHIFVSHLRNSYQPASASLRKSLVQIGVRELVNLILWFRNPIESKAYRPKMSHQKVHNYRSVPLLDAMPVYIENAIMAWNQRIYQSMFLADEGNLLAPPDCSAGAATSVIGGLGEGGRQFGPRICAAQLLLESKRVAERVSPAVDGLSGHAYAYVASGVNKHNLSSLFAIPYDALPVLDPWDVEVKSKQGFLLHLIFNASTSALANGLADDLAVTALFDAVEVRYGADKYAVIRELKDLRGALRTIERFVDAHIPLAAASEDPAKKVIQGAIDRVNLFIKKDS